MLHILLLILKIIGIILLVILGLLLLIIGCILFVPVRYRFNVRYYEAIEAKAGVSWLLHIISVQVQYAQKVHLVIKIFGIPLFDNQKPKKNKKAKAQTPPESEETPAKPSLPEKVPEGKNAQLPPENAPSANAQTSSEVPNEKDSDVHTIDNPEETPEKLRPREKISQKLQAVREKICSLREKVRLKLSSLNTSKNNLLDKVKNIQGKKDKVMTILTDEKNQRSFKKIKNQVVKVLRHIRPRRFFAKLWFGFDDPSTTGMLLGVCGMLYPVYTNHIELHPDFEKNLLQGEFRTRGRIQAFIFVKAACILILDKNIRSIITSIKNI